CFSWFIGPAPYCSASQDEHVVFQAHRDRFPGTVAHRFTVLSWPLCTGALGAPTETPKGHITKIPTTSPDILRKYPRRDKSTGTHNQGTRAPSPRSTPINGLP